MTLEADLDAMVRAAAGVAGVAGEVGLARTHAAYGEGKGHEFGFYAQRAGIDDQHDRFIGAMVDALGDGRQRLTRIAEIVQDIAREFGATDVDVADEFHTRRTEHV